ncbi:MAG: polysaccharide pyruvyl transferase family protein [Candidatus Muirbacterium halophilum]|nr:polysaccharide pyruvyl transferase family protein [Candidatus Muirbacterium halophilum]MCK9475371.1 polysaccharide pyruvyl transferase family protein [Candidatus Muirbacterium halophilum]
MKKKSEFLLYGYFGYKNLGDELILNSFLNLYPESIVFSASNSSSSVKRFSFLNLLNKNPIVFPGGNILQNKSSSKSLYFYIIFIFLCKLLRKKIYLINNGFGPIKGKFNYFLFKKAILLCDFISCRTKSDFEFIEFYNNKVLGADTFFVNNNKNRLNNGKKTAYIPKSRYIKNYNLNQDIDILAMEPYDYEFFAKNYVNRNIIKLYNMKLHEIEAKMAEYKTIYAIPLHGVILSYYFGVKNIFVIPYDDKVLNFCKEIDHEVNLLKSIDDIEKIQSKKIKINKKNKLAEFYKRAFSFEKYLF